MNDLDRARQLREKSEERAANERCVGIAEIAILNLPTNVVWPERFMGLMLAMLGLADELGIDRKTVLECFATLAAAVPPIGVEGIDLG